jgi:menaquinone-dependent protoporphyrinogen oxidase
MTPAPFVTYVASRDGHSGLIAARILRRLDHDPATVVRLDKTTPEIDPARPVLLVAAVRYGDHLPTARAFLKAYARLAQRPPIALVSVNLTARKPNRQTAEACAYLKKSIKAFDLAPVAARAFAGKVDYPRYRWGDRQMIRLIMLLTGGPTKGVEVIEYTDWADVDAFADALPAAFGLSDAG